MIEDPQEYAALERLARVKSTPSNPFDVPAPRSAMDHAREAKRLARKAQRLAALSMVLSVGNLAWLIVRVAT